MFRERGSFMKSDMNRRIVKGDTAGNATIIGGCRKYNRDDIGIIISKKFMPYFNELITNFFRMYVEATLCAEHF